MDRNTAEPPVRADGLQIADAPRFQHRFWRIQRWCWVGFALVVVAALAGLTGAGGPLSRGLLALAGGEIDHPRITRWQGADTMIVRFGPGGAERSLHLSAPFWAGFEVEEIQPRPDRVIAAPDGQAMIFTAAVPAASGQGQAPQSGAWTAHLQIRPSSPGIIRAEASIDGDAAAGMTVVVLP